MISAREEPDASLPPAIDGLLKVHKRIIDGLDGGDLAQTSGTGGIVSTRLLVPASQVGFLIGKHGAVIKSIQESAKSVVRVVGMVFSSLVHEMKPLLVSLRFVTVYDQFTFCYMSHEYLFFL